MRFPYKPLFLLNLLPTNSQSPDWQQHEKPRETPNRLEKDQKIKRSKDRSLRQLQQSEHQKAISYALAEGASGRRTAAPLAPTGFKCDESPDPWFPA
jgi:hypothetical protein